MTMKKQIENWFDRGVKDGATHMIVMCDTFDYEDYPVYLKEENSDSAQAKVNEHVKNMQTVMEVYNLKMDKLSQLNQPRVFNY